jgi:hypothetical protein
MTLQKEFQISIHPTQPNTHKPYVLNNENFNKTNNNIYKMLLINHNCFNTLRK